MNDYKIFVSHGSHDTWLAGQMAKEIRIVGATPFLDETSIPKGSLNFKQIIKSESKMSQEWLFCLHRGRP